MAASLLLDIYPRVGRECIIPSFQQVHIYTDILALKTIKRLLLVLTLPVSKA